MLWIKNLNCHKIGFCISSLVFVLGLFFSVFFATDSFALTQVSLPYNPPFVFCSEQTISCSGYNFLHVRIDIPVPTSNLYFNINVDNISLSRLYFTPSDHLTINRDFYFDISSATIVQGAAFNVSSGILYYELLTSLSSDVVPSGTLNITQNGIYDVSSYATAEVNVPPVMGDYHDDLQQGITAIYVLGGVMLVIYFFYCIYRMIIKNVGGD